MVGTFLTYHVVKAVLWRMGYFAKFFYRQRFLSIPVLIFGFFYNIKLTFNDMRKSDLIDYNTKRTKFDKDSYVIERVL